MRDTTDIEKQSLEAHVELCAHRYDSMTGNIERLGDRLSRVEMIAKEIKDMLTEKETQAYRKLLSIGVAIIGSLITALMGITMYLIKSNF